jgi:hypothetical protein
VIDAIRAVEPIPVLVAMVIWVWWKPQRKEQR